MSHDHHYAATVAWSGSTASGYAAYSREHDLQWSDELLTLSADAAFRGDASLPNPSSCCSPLRVRDSSCLFSLSRPSLGSTSSRITTTRPR